MPLFGLMGWLPPCRVVYDFVMYIMTEPDPVSGYEDFIIKPICFALALLSPAFPSY